MHILKKIHHKFPGYLFLKKLKQNRKIKQNHIVEETQLNMLDEFPAFVPNSAGAYDVLAKLTIQSINQILPSLKLISDFQNQEIIEYTVDNFMTNIDTKDRGLLKDYLDAFGSDKASTHDYYLIYAKILSKREKITKILEIGLGTNNTDVASNMGKQGQPGASLRAFKSYCKNAQIFGADFDERVLFNESRIQTFFVDQTNTSTFDKLGEQIDNNFDLMIDDGLHSPNANLNSLTFFLPRLKTKGWAIIEGIPNESIDVWHLVTHLLPKNFKTYIIKTKAAYVFAVQKS